MNKIPVTLEFYVKFNRPDKKIFVSLFEVFDNNRLLSALACDDEVKIRFWDNEKTLENKIKVVKTKLLMRYFKDKELNENIFKMCKTLSEGKIEAGFLELASTNEALEKTTKEDNILNLQDFLDKRK